MCKYVLITSVPSAPSCSPSTPADLLFPDTPLFAGASFPPPPAPPPLLVSATPLYFIWFLTIS